MHALQGPGATANQIRRLNLLGFHACRSNHDLDLELGRLLPHLLDEQSYCLFLTADDGQLLTTTVMSDRGPWQTRQLIAADSLKEGDALPVLYGSHVLGQLHIAGDLATQTRADLQLVLEHYGTALANLTLGAEARDSAANYSASLEAFEQGIVLFQETDSAKITARLIALAVSMADAAAGALYVLDKAGDPESDLHLEQILSIPLTVLHGLDEPNGEPWPKARLTKPTFFAERQTDPTLGGLTPERIPPFVDNMLSVPLCYQGIEAGVITLFNVDTKASSPKDLIERFTTFGRLGAAILHRLQLESATARQRSLEKELEIAASIQRRLLPTTAPEVPGFDVAWHSLSANHIGGDYLDLLTSDNGDLHAIIADASGHGIDSALLMSSFRGAYRAATRRQQPDQFLSDLNAEVANEVGQTGMFLTAAALQIQQADRQLQISSAGHNPVLLYRAHTRTIETIGAHGPPLGFLPQATYTAETHQLDSGDVLLLYTDGVSEATNSQRAMFGDEQLARLLQRNGHLGARELLQLLLSQLARFTSNAPNDDDLSLSIIKAR
ncbi:MAG: PP2C family protein-serine/threonine phosphatase [Planctomycetota bacterium]|nr:PP2C family protein-serine/threonine phosphatase [Planctomycetota bacterium]